MATSRRCAKSLATPCCWERPDPVTEPIVSLDQIKQQAAQAAEKFTDVNDACPYPFYTDAGRTFKQEFTRVRMQMFAARHAKTTGDAA